MNNPNINKILVATIFVLLIALGALTINIAFYNSGPITINPLPDVLNFNSDKSTNVKIEKFESEQAFKDYIAQSGDGYGYYGVMGRAVTVTSDVVMEESLNTGLEFGVATGLGTNKAITMDSSGSGDGAYRVSDTNVQVKGIDEPDILKTDGKNIYYSQTQKYYPYVTTRDIFIDGNDVIEFAPERQTPTNQTRVVNAFPPEDLAEIGGINRTGEMLLEDNNLVIFDKGYYGNDRQIYGFDVSNPKTPTENWKIRIDDRSWIHQSRMYNGKLYIITRQNVNHYEPCPIRPLILEDNVNSLTIACTDIYHPVTPTNVDSTYTVFEINPKNGEVENKVSFVGSNGSSIVYMSTNSIYITYTIQPDVIGFFYDFLNTKMRDIVPESMISRLNKLRTYDISQSAKMTEFQNIMSEFYNSLDRDDELKMSNEFENRMSDYMKEHQRELDKTGIVKIDIDNLDVTASGQVAGSPLNQFSLDEYEGNLRIATTIGNTRSFFFGSTESVSDVTILDKNLDYISSVTGLGEGEKIYSVRFIQDKGYVVTFRQIDPFYVVDLSNPKKPEVKGELKIPGFSSYLHPIDKDTIVGVGQEDNKVKISLFDVSNPSNPTEDSKYMLDEYWTEVSNTHHAFLQDNKHGIFFMPGSKGGYIFSYQNNDLKLEKAVSGIQVKRALYLDDYMYIAGENEIIVLNENDWERVNELSFDN